jgi:AmmeMemoRadiSam system protein B
LELLQTGEFTTMNRKTDEQEHSGEMQYPYIAKIYTEVKSIHKDIRPLRILPIMVGATSHARHFGHLLAPILSRPNIFTVISTDFCHWGSRFGYSPTNSTDEAQSFSEIHEYIEWLDRQGMDKISLQEPGAFATYMKRYKNTICGRYPISVYLYALKKGKESDFENLDLRFVKYAQSSRVKTLNESSVSYASAVARKIS